ncbi:carbonic anhydrase [Bifidobacterium saguini DSM 23967]|uniref:carbonic anhydrase n=2 Tax=Bifidobacterium saguini TaxID=762210 RepID=A0A087D862_9BIFI|nr:carbonic anhydrase [Bifidobacterium saguini DSM 23967]
MTQSDFEQNMQDIQNKNENEQTAPAAPEQQAAQESQAQQPAQQEPPTPQPAESVPPTSPLPSELHESTANATWSRMLQGNKRFAEGKAEHPWQDKETRHMLTDGQKPDAAVLSCSDSRVPPEIIFDQGLGDLFTVRTAGQMIDDAVIASLEYAVKKLHVSLLCVLGHGRCGALEVAEREYNELLRTITAEAEDSSETADIMDDLDERIAQSDSIVLRQAGISVWQAREAELDCLDDIERVHVAHTIETLVDRSPVIQQALASEQLMIVGARYQLDTGRIEVLSF